MLVGVVLILHTRLEPVVAIEIDDDAALVKPVVALREVRLDDETEVFLFGLHLKYRGVVVAKMVVGALPQVGMRPGHHLYGASLDGAALGLTGPYEGLQAEPTAAVLFRTRHACHGRALGGGFVHFIEGVVGGTLVTGKNLVW